MDDDELIKYGINGTRLKLTRILRSIPYDTFMISLIILYCLLIVLFFAYIDNAFSTSDDNVHIFEFLEISILAVFGFDIIVHCFGYGLLYVKDYWNIVDTVIIILSLVFIFLLIFIDNQSAQKVFLNIKGVFRLLRIFLLFRKLTQLKEKRDIQKRKKISKGFDMRAPLERVLEILNSLRVQIDVDEAKLIMDLNYCIKVISNNTLYEANLEYEGEAGGGNNKERNEMQMLVGAYTKT